MEILIELLAVVGAGVIFTVLCFVILYIRDQYLPKIKRDYQVKHRFDKPPTAKCYCVDCVYYDPIDSRTGLCSLSSSGVYIDNHFCAKASPAKNSRR